jgi:adenosylcobinamide-GDP ribazoletransferase
MIGLVVALQFLTRIPVNIPVDFTEKTIAKSTFFFPFVGLLVGALSGLTYHAMLFANKEIASLGAVIALIVITGGLHIDGLSDTCDGFFSSRRKEAVLEIMKDSRSGTFGVIAVVVDILIKYILLLNTEMQVLPCLMLSCANARLTAVMLMSFTRSARPGGLGAMFSNSDTKKYFYLGSIVYIVLVIFFFDFKHMLPLMAALLSSLFIAKKSYKTIGGLTGDVYGANIEICEVVSLAMFQVVAKWI